MADGTLLLIAIAVAAAVAHGIWRIKKVQPQEKQRADPATSRPSG